MPDYSKLGERDLILLLKEQDHSAFNEIYERSWSVLFKTAYLRLKDKEVCKDIIHDVFADLWNRSDNLDIQNLQAYLQTAVRYKIYSWLAKGSNTAHFVEPFESMAVDGHSADTWFEAKELEHLIELWIATLPRKRGQIFQLRYMENLSTKDISEKLNISQKTVQNQLLTANNELQAHLSNYMVVVLIAGCLPS